MEDYDEEEEGIETYEEGNVKEVTLVSHRKEGRMATRPKGGGVEIRKQTRHVVRVRRPISKPMKRVTRNMVRIKLLVLSMQRAGKLHGGTFKQAQRK